MDVSSWQHAHRDALARRLDALKAQPDGVLYETMSGTHHIRILKHAGQIQFYFVSPRTGALDGPMSRLDLDHPLQLLAEYSQAAMLALLWHQRPERICLLGLAGGRLSLLFYHYFPASMIDNVDVDPAVIPIATSYFGLTFDTRQTITISDARAYLAALAPDIAYDIIVLDAFEDSTDALDHLATTQFYQECRRRLVCGGVLVVNMLKSDPRFLSKLKTLLHSFRHVAGVAQKHGLVLFGTDRTKLSQTAIMQRAWQLQHQHQFEFPLIERAAALQPLRAHPAYPSRVLRAIPLLNDSPCSE